MKIHPFQSKTSRKQQTRKGRIFGSCDEKITKSLWKSSNSAVPSVELKMEKTPWHTHSITKHRDTSNSLKKSPHRQEWPPCYTVFFRTEGYPVLYLLSNIQPAYTDKIYVDAFDASFGNDFVSEWKYFVESSRNMIPEKKEKFDSPEFIFVIIISCCACSGFLKGFKISWLFRNLGGELFIPKIAR